MSQYDRKRIVKETLLERAISTAIEMSDARRMLVAAILSRKAKSQISRRMVDDLSNNDRQAVKLYSHLMAGRRCEVEEEIRILPSSPSRRKAPLRPAVARRRSHRNLSCSLASPQSGLTLLTWLPHRGCSIKPSSWSMLPGIWSITIRGPERCHRVSTIFPDRL